MKLVIFAWTPALRAAVEQAKAVRPVHILPYLFCTRRRRSYVKEKDGTTSGFDSIWDRFRNRVYAETDIKIPFIEHDFRAKTGSDAESVNRAKELLVHESEAMTRQVYRRKAEVVAPLR